MSKQLYESLMALIDETNPSGFYFVDQTNEVGSKVRMFGYYVVSYSDWLKENALEARGITFNIDDEENPVLLCRPMKKYFNLNENPFTLNLNMSKLALLMDKADGSLVSFYSDKNILLCKTKMNCHSEQAIAAKSLILNVNYADLYERVKELTQKGYTVNFEYVGPDNRIVLFYPEQKLILLNIRDNETGEYVPYHEIYADGVLRKYLVPSVDLKTVNARSFVRDTLRLTNMEGYVGILQDGTWFKLKTRWYSTLHKTKEDLMTREKTLVAITNGVYDDLYSLVSSDSEKAYLDKALKIFTGFLDESIKKLNLLYSQNRGLERKEFAINGQNELRDQMYLFHVYMKMFDGLEMDKLVDVLTQTFIKHVDQFKEQL